ncbi:hypothetical protein BDZ90DRAFT_230293 [Jaminaea rosea]|uniref:Uncharacterized protein n=1 Tax=Jaminaea rosea TaxID=1569628 RepID=A0A316UXB9_9BASI|nr:hypothetical protein BDZ90DRAFT_230293 [Jaminaea rosea]PWN29418.1 hypothetical protein BDZ90DRAFT_230293 [Jaminaea rosea]
MDALGDAARKDRLISAPLYIVPAATGAAQVMASWQTVFRGIQVAQASVADRTRPTEGADPDEEEERLATLVPDTLVRIPVDQSYASGQQAGQQQQESGEEA